MIRKQSIFILFLFIWNIARAQAPDGVPYGEPEPLEFTPFNIILYFVIPFLLIIFYFIYRRKQKKKHKEQQKK